MKQWLNMQTNSQIWKQFQPDLLGLTLRGLGIFLSYWKKSRTNQKANPSLFLDWWYKLISYLGRVIWLYFPTRSGLDGCVQSQEDLSRKATPDSLLTAVGYHSSMTGHLFLSMTWACRSPSLMFNPVFSCPYQPLLLPSTTPESAVCTSPDSAK